MPKGIYKRTGLARKNMSKAHMGIATPWMIGNKNQLGKVPWNKGKTETGNYINIAGKKFNKLTAIKFHHRNFRDYFWEFKCDCGNVCIKRKRNVMGGQTKSCGCFQKESGTMNRTHGLTETKFYQVWRGILNRCNLPNVDNYHLYGGRGIKCLWKNFIEFRDDMYESYLEHTNKFPNDTSIDRIDNDGHYCKENCRWATSKEQLKNQRIRKNAVIINFQGKNYTYSELFKQFGLTRYFVNKTILGKNTALNHSERTM